VDLRVGPARSRSTSRLRYRLSARTHETACDRTQGGRFGLEPEIRPDGIGSAVPEAAGNRISVIIPTLNAGRHLADCLGSLNVQGYDNCEVHLVDCGSTDDTLDVARRFGVPITLASNLRLLGQLHLGVSESRADFCLFLDGDQVLAPSVLWHLAHNFGEFDAVILGEHGYSPKGVLSRLADMDRQLAQRDFERQSDPIRGMLNPRYYRRADLLSAFTRIPSYLETESTNWNDAIIYYEMSRQRLHVGFFPRAVFHNDRDDWREFVSHYFTYGRNLRRLSLPPKYKELVRSKMRGRAVIRQRNLRLRDRVASTIYMGIKFIPHTLGFLSG
jgi:glycosyltransferase involved in cell wall biosynthesis